jgi:maltose alpha-D-glucosyltransferase/alpha-amylase
VESGRDDGLWYKDAIIYAVDVQMFQDSDGDGIGDLPGLTARLDYLSALGVTCLWLLPFYHSPDRDNGYDIADYMTIAGEYGGLEAFAALREAATARGIRLLTDLVVQHTSDEHPWFQASRANDPLYREYYVWTDNPPPRTAAKQIFPGVEDGIWTWDETRNAAYLHQFYVFEPDLNVESEAVMEEIHAIISRWLDLGVDGFRIDAASLALGTEALQPQPSRQPFQFIRYLRECVNRHPRGGVMMAEGGIVRERLDEYFGGQDGVQMLFNFPLVANLFLALARQEGEPLARGLELLPAPPECGQWTIFLRNLDELNLQHLSESERQEVFRAFAPRPEMRIYRRGIRRRLAPMLAGDRRRIELAYSLLLTMPGSPIIVYGDELGMGEDLDLPERQSVRTVMQWSAEPNAGFSTAPSAALTMPAISEGPFGYDQVNVTRQEADQASLLRWFRRAIAVRKALPELGRGACRVVPTDDPRVVALCSSWQGGETVCVHNLSPEVCTVGLDLDGGTERLLDQFADQTYAPVSGDGRVDLGPYGYRWLRRGDGDRMP